MKRLRLLSIIFIFIAIIAFIPLTIEVFGDMKLNVIKISASIMLAGLVSSCICLFIRAIGELKDK